MMKHASDVMMTDENIKGHFGSVLVTKCHWTYGQMFLAITVVSDRINSEQDRTTFRIDSTTRLYF
jgi:hypothetical protein